MYFIDIKELKKAMIDAELDSIQALSDKSGVNRNTVADTVNGNSLPSSDVMRRIATALDLSSERAGRIFFATDLALNASTKQENV